MQDVTPLSVTHDHLSGKNLTVIFASQDEQSALVMVKKHQTLEQALEDYAQTIHQLANSSRLMVTSEHPER